MPTKIDELTEKLRADIHWVESDEISPRAKITALGRIQRNSRRLRKLIVMSVADTPDEVEPKTERWSSPSKLTTVPRARTER